MKNLDKFKHKDKVVCWNCGEVTVNLSSINVRTADHSRRYIGSNRPIINTYSAKVCDTCYKTIMAGINKAFS